MIVADSSAWIAFLRRTQTEADLTLTRLIEDGAPLVLIEPVLMEVLAGAKAGDAGRLRDRLVSFPVVPTQPIVDFERAAAIYRLCRSEGEAVRSLLDCLIAAIALRVGAEVLHDDSDFDVISRHAGLAIHRSKPGT